MFSRIFPFCYRNIDVNLIIKIMSLLVFYFRERIKNLNILQIIYKILQKSDISQQLYPKIVIASNKYRLSNNVSENFDYYSFLCSHEHETRMIDQKVAKHKNQQAK